MCYCFGVLALPCQAPAVLLAEPGDACMGSNKAASKDRALELCRVCRQPWDHAGCCSNPKHMWCVRCWGAEQSFLQREPQTFGSGSCWEEGQDLTWIAGPTSRWIFGKRDIDVT